MFALRHGYARMQQNSGLSGSQFNALVRSELGSRRSPSPMDFFLAATRVVKKHSPARQKCGCAKGRYDHPGAPAHKGEMCYFCAGKGYYTQDDIVRGGWWQARSSQRAQEASEDYDREVERHERNPLQITAPLLLVGNRRRRNPLVPLLLVGNPNDIICSGCGRPFGRGRALYVPTHRQWFHEKCFKATPLPPGTRAFKREPTEEALAKHAEFDARLRGEKQNPSRRRNDAEQQGGPRQFKLRLPSDRVLGTLSLEEARRRWPGRNQVPFCVAAARDFHKADPGPEVTIVDNGSKEYTFGWTAGESPEVTYSGSPDQVPDGSIKGDALYVHKTDENDRTGKMNRNPRPTYLVGLAPKDGNPRSPKTKDFMLVGHMVAHRGWLRR